MSRWLSRWLSRRLSCGCPAVVLWLSRGCPVARGKFSKKGSASGVVLWPAGCPAGCPVGCLVVVPWLSRSSGQVQQKRFRFRCRTVAGRLARWLSRGCPVKSYMKSNMKSRMKYYTKSYTKSYMNYDGNYDAKSNAKSDVKSSMHSNKKSYMKSYVKSF